MPESSNRLIHELACFVHGCLTSLHFLGVCYNVRRGNRWQAVAHAAGVAFSAQSTYHHCQVARAKQ